MKPKLLCILGETCSGKDSIVNKALENLSKYNIRKVCSYTDRPMRNNETNGIEHYFITTTEFNKLKKTRENDILAYTHIKDKKQSNYKGYQYMALSNELDISHIYIIDYNGLLYLKERFEDTIDIITIYITAPLSTRLKRAELSRSDFKTEFIDRVKAEEAQFEIFRKQKLYDYKILNKDGYMEKSIGKLCNIIDHELIRPNIVTLRNPLH